MSFNRQKLSPEEIDKWFLDVPDVPAGLFELGLVLGGTVSAGAYTAGALDFLIEALDCFSAAKTARAAPDHEVVLKLIAGTSGGGVNAAIVARALAYDCPRGDRVGNPLRDLWIDNLHFEDFLNISDIKGGVPSLLSGEPIDDAARKIADFESGEPIAREWSRSRSESF